MGRTVLRNLGPGRIRDQLRTIALTTEDKANPTFRLADTVMPSGPCQGADRRTGRCAPVRRDLESTGEWTYSRSVGDWIRPDRSRTRWQDRSYIRCSYGAACS